MVSLFFHLSSKYQSKLLKFNGYKMKQCYLKWGSTELKYGYVGLEVGFSYPSIYCVYTATYWNLPNQYLNLKPKLRTSEILIADV